MGQTQNISSRMFCRVEDSLQTLGVAFPNLIVISERYVNLELMCLMKIVFYAVNS